MLFNLVKALGFAVIFFLLHICAVNLAYYSFHGEFVISPSTWHYFGWVEYLSGGGILFAAALVLELIRAFKAPFSFMQDFSDKGAMIIKVLGFTGIILVFHIVAVNSAYYIFNGATVFGHWEWLGWSNLYVLGTGLMLIATLVLESVRAFVSKN